MTGVEPVRREQFTRTLSQLGSINLSRLTPEMETAFRQAGISPDDLREIAGADATIQGPEEFEQLFQRLQELETASPRRDTAESGAPSLDRASQLFESLRTELQRPAPTDTASRPATVGVGVRPRPRYAVEQTDNRPSTRAPTDAQISVQRETLALRAYDNMRAAGFLADAPTFGTQLPAELADRFAAAYPEESAALRGRAPTYRDLFVALSRDHDGNGTVDVRANDLTRLGLFGSPARVTEREAAAIVLGTGGRGVVSSGLVDGDAAGTGLVNRANQRTARGVQVQRQGERSSLGLVVENPSASTSPDAQATRVAVLLRQGDAGRATLLRELAEDPGRMAALAAVANSSDLEASSQALAVLNQLAVGPNATLRDAAASVFVSLPAMSGPREQARQTITALDAGRAEIGTRAADLRTSADRAVSSVYGDARGRGGMRATLEGGSRIGGTARRITETAQHTRDLLAQNQAQIRRLETLQAGLPANAPERAQVAGELRRLRQERVELLDMAADVAVRLERAAWGMADDTGWVRATHMTGTRRRAMETAGQLASDVRDMMRTEIDAQAMSSGADQIAIGRLNTRAGELERTVIDNRAHLRTFAAQVRIASGNDEHRLQVLSATRDTIALIQRGFPSDPALVRRAEEGDQTAIAQVAAEREQELRALGVNPQDPVLQGRSTLQIIVDLAKNGDPVATARLAQAQAQIVSAIDQGTTMLRDARGTPRQLEAMATLRSIASRYDFTRPGDLSSFDLGTLNTQFEEQLRAAGLQFTPQAELDRMREVRDQTVQFTLLTDLAAGVVEPAREAERDENAARRLAQDRAIADPNHAYIVVRQQVGSNTVFRVRAVENNDAAIFRAFTEQRGLQADAGAEAPFGSVYMARRVGLFIEETDRFSSYSTNRDVQDVFRPASAGGVRVDASMSSTTQDGMYRVMYDRASVRVADRYRTAISALDQYGVGTTPNRELFETRMRAVVTTLRNQSFDPPTVRIEGRGDVPRGLAQLEEICMLLGEDRTMARDLAQRLWNGQETFLYTVPDPEFPQTIELNIYQELFNSGRGAHTRFNERLTEVTSAFRGGEDGRNQVFELYREFPDLATEFYRASGFTALEGFPPRLRDGAQPGSAAEAAFLRDATAWQESEERWGYLKMGGLIAAGILITVASGGLAGPEVAIAAGIIFAAGTSGYEVIAASERLGRARDARAVGAGSDRNVRYHENELTGAYGALVINVATAGLAAKFGGGQLASQAARLTVRSVVREAVVGATIGFGAGALTAAANPNVWESPNTFGLIMHGAVVGMGGGAIGGVGGRLGAHGFEASGIGRRISLAFARTPENPSFRVGMEVQVAIEGQSQPQTWRVRSINEGTGRAVIEREGQTLEVAIREAQLLTVDENNPSVTALRTLRDSETGGSGTRPPQAETPPAQPRATIVDPPVLPAQTGGTLPRSTAGRGPGRTTSTPEGPSAEFQARVASEAPMLSEAVRGISGPNAEAIRSSALGAAERNPQIRWFIERGGTQAARAVGELGEAGFMRAFSGREGISWETTNFFRDISPRQATDLITFARNRPSDVAALMDGLANSRNRPAIMEALSSQGVEAAARLGRISAEAPRGLEYLLTRPGGQREVLASLRTNPESLVARASELEGRIYQRTIDGELLLRGEPPRDPPAPSRQQLEELCQRAGVDPAVLDNPTANPDAMQRLITQMRSEMSAPQRQALDREIAGRRFVDNGDYEAARQAGVTNPEHVYSRRDFTNWMAGQEIILRAAQAGRPMTIELLQQAHRQAARGIVSEQRLGVLRSNPADVARQGGEGPIGIQTVTADQLATMRANPDLVVADLGPVDGTTSHRVQVTYLAPERVQARLQQCLDRMNTRLAAGEDPVVVAADAQQEMVSIHPFHDGNGRMSRLLMDYALARSGRPFSVVSNPNLDTMLTPDAWRAEVRAGMQRPFDATMRAWSGAQSGSSASTSRPFMTESARRQSAFESDFQRAAPGRSADDARALFELAGGQRTDVVTGFGAPEDLAPSLGRAAAHVRETGEAAVAVRASLRNLGGMNNRLAHSQADPVLAEFANIVRSELQSTGAQVSAFRDGPDMSFILTGREVPQAAVDAALARAQARIAARVQELGLNTIDHPKHPGDPNWRGVGISTSTSRIAPGDTAATIDTALAAGVERYNRSLGQVPSPYPTVTPSAAELGAPTTQPRGPTRAEGAPRFQDSLAHREAQFLARAREMGIRDTEARRMFNELRPNLVDQVTGFARGEDRIPTLDRAIAHARATGENAHYVEIDVSNLGGLNRAIGPRAADADFAVCARAIREELAGIGADVSLFRHGGDEMSAVVVGPNVTRAQVDAALARAQARFAAYVRARGLSEIPHPKHMDDPSRRGVGFTFASAQAGPNEAASAVIGRADTEIELVKARSRGAQPDTRPQGLVQPGQVPQPRREREE